MAAAARTYARVPKGEQPAKASLGVAVPAEVHALLERLRERAGGDKWQIIAAALCVMREWNTSDLRAAIDDFNVWWEHGGEIPAPRGSPAAERLRKPPTDGGSTETEEASDRATHRGRAAQPRRKRGA